MSSVPTLQYADLTARWGVSIEASPSAFRVAVQPTWGWGSVFAAYQKAAIVFFVLLALSVLTVLTQAPLEWPALAANALIYGMPLVIIATVVHARLRRRVVFEVTPDRVSYATLWPSGRGETMSWPRERIGYAKLNPYDHKMTLQIIGLDLLQVWISPKREVTEFVANKLDEALRTMPREPIPVGGGMPLPLLAVRSRSLPRWAAFVISILMACGGVALIANQAAVAPLGAYLLLLSPFPIGIAYGTQPKKFWV